MPDIQKRQSVIFRGRIRGVCIMIVVEPTPRRDTTVVIVHHPLSAACRNTRLPTSFGWLYEISSLSYTSFRKHTDYPSKMKKMSWSAYPIVTPLPLVHLLLHWSLIPHVKSTTHIDILHLHLSVLLQHPIDSRLTLLVVIINVLPISVSFPFRVAVCLLSVQNNIMWHVAKSFAVADGSKWLNKARTLESILKIVTL